MHKGKILLLNGPNLNMLGQRDPTQYGNFSLADAEDLARHTAAELGYTLEARQSNHEGQLIDWIQEAREGFAAIVINAGAYTHYSIAIGDALDVFPGAKVEVHISDIHKREAFRQHSAIRYAVDGQIAGFGLASYKYGVMQAVDLIEGRRSGSREGRTDEVFVGVEE